MERIIALSDFNIEPILGNSFKDLVKLAAKIAGTEVSLVNLIDSYTQWSVSSHGIDLEQMPREDSVCQYTIMGDSPFEVQALDNDERFKDKFYVTGDPHLRYYFGIPLKYQQYNLGALCVLDKTAKVLTPEKVEMLQIIAEEVANRLKVHKYIEQLRNNITDVTDTRNKIIHDIRGPIAGIIGLAEIISMQGTENDMDEVLELINMMYKGGKSVLELADDILTGEKKKSQMKGNELNLKTFKERLEHLYGPQARSKNLLLRITVIDSEKSLAFPQNKLIQIAGNLISNAIKFTPSMGDVTVLLELKGTEKMTLNISVTNTGEGISNERIAELMADNTTSTDGTAGETGFGFGLQLVKHLIKSAGGTLSITSVLGQHTSFVASMPAKVRELV
jgi:signal transduction histidine kinase